MWRRSDGADWRCFWITYGGRDFQRRIAVLHQRNFERYRVDPKDLHSILRCAADVSAKNATQLVSRGNELSIAALLLSLVILWSTVSLFTADCWVLVACQSAVAQCSFLCCSLPSSTDDHFQTTLRRFPLIAPVLSREKETALSHRRALRILYVQNCTPSLSLPL